MIDQPHNSTRQRGFQIANVLNAFNPPPPSPPHSASPIFHDLYMTKVRFGDAKMIDSRPKGDDDAVDGTQAVSFAPSVDAVVRELILCNLLCMARSNLADPYFSYYSS